MLEPVLVEPRELVEPRVTLRVAHTVLDECFRLTISSAVEVEASVARTALCSIISTTSPSPLLASKSNLLVVSLMLLDKAIVREDHVGIRDLQRRK